MSTKKELIVLLVLILNVGGADLEYYSILLEDLITLDTLFPRCQLLHTCGNNLLKEIPDHVVCH